MTESTNIDNYKAASLALRDKNLRQALYDEGSIIMKDVLVNLHGEQHKSRRMLETKVFRRDFFKYYESEVFPQTLRETLNPFVEAGKMDLVDFGYRVMVNLTADFTGIDRQEKSPEETAELMRLLRIFGKTATLAHATGDKDAVKEEAFEALERFDQRFVQPSITRRLDLLGKWERGEISEDAVPRDILAVLLRNEDGIDMPRDVLTREMAFFALAGAHTSIHTLTHAVHELFGWLESRPEDKQFVLEEPRFIQKCVLESIRLHPSSPIAARRTLCPMDIESKHIGKDSKVIIDLQSANRSKTIFGEDAGTFNPNRSLPKGQSRYGLSFGQGMHACLGLNLAAGVLPPEGKSVDHMGTVALIVQSLFKTGITPDPNQTPEKDKTTARDLWGYYPIIFR